MNDEDRGSGFDQESELRTATERLHLLDAAIVATEQPHRVLDVVVEAADAFDAMSRLRREFGFTESQATLVVDMQFRRMANVEKQRLMRDLAETRALVEKLSR